MHMLNIHVQVLQSNDMAEKATLLFILQPSSPFTLAPYTGLTVCCSVLQCVAVVLQCIAVSCTLLHCVAVC